MTIVIDANLLASQALPLPYGDLAARRLLLWKQTGERLIAPTLLEYEVTTILRKAVFQKWVDTAVAKSLLSDLMSSGPELIIPDLTLGQDALVWAERIGQSKAYDAQYLALAAREGAPLWTADRRLANSAQQAGLDRVHWIGDWRP